jgi:hypothetical protein
MFKYGQAGQGFSERSERQSSYFFITFLVNFFNIFIRIILFFLTIARIAIRKSKISIPKFPILSIFPPLTCSNDLFSFNFIYLLIFFNV